MIPRLIRLLHAPARSGARHAIHARIRCPLCDKDTAHRRPVRDEALFGQQHVRCGWCRQQFTIDASRAEPSVRLMGWCGLSAAATVVAVLWWMSDQGLSVLDLALLGIALVSVAETLVWDITRRIVGRRLDVVQSTPQER